MDWIATKKDNDKKLQKQSWKRLIQKVPLNGSNNFDVIVLCLFLSVDGQTFKRQQGMCESCGQHIMS